MLHNKKNLLSGETEGVGGGVGGGDPGTPPLYTSSLVYVFKCVLNICVCVCIYLYICV